MVYTGLFPIDNKDYENLRDALEKLHVNDPSLVWEPETSAALGFGLRVGFLGLLHMEVIKERLEREFDLALIATSPSVDLSLIHISVIVNADFNSLNHAVCKSVFIKSCINDITVCKLNTV